MPRRTHLLAATAGALAALAVPAAAHAAAGFQSPTTVVSGSGSQLAADTAAGADGTVAAAYLDGSTWKVSVAPPGQPLEAADALSPSFPGGVLSKYPQIAVDSGGNTLAVWSGGSGSTGAAYWAYRPAGDDFTAGDTLGTANVVWGNPRVAIRPDDTAVATWIDPDGSVKVAERPAGATSDFTDLDDLAPVGSVSQWASFGTAIAAAPDGSVAVLWGQTASGGNQTVRVAVKRPGEAQFDAADTVATVSASNTVNPSIAFRADGGLDVLWRTSVLQFSPFAEGGAIVATGRAAATGSAWSTPTALATVPATSLVTSLSAPALVEHASGSATAVWGQRGGTAGTSTVERATRTGTTFGSGVTVASLTATTPQTAAAGLCGDSTLAVWWRSGGLAAAALRGDGTVEALTPLTGLTADVNTPSLATTPDGERGIVLWTSATGSTTQTDVALFDDAEQELCAEASR